MGWAKQEETGPNIGFRVIVSLSNSSLSIVLKTQSDLTTTIIINT